MQNEELEYHLELDMNLNLKLNLELNLEPSMKLIGCLDIILQIVVAVCRLQFAVYLSQQKC